MSKSRAKHRYAALPLPLGDLGAFGHEAVSPATDSLEDRVADARRARDRDVVTDDASAVQQRVENATGRTSREIERVHLDAERAEHVRDDDAASAGW